MNDNNHDQGSQSKAVVLASTLFLALLCATFVWIMYTGPNPDSVFPLFRTALFVYPAGLLGALLFGALTCIGIKRLKAM